MRWKAELPLGCEELVDMVEVLTQHIKPSTPHHLLLARARFLFQLAQRRDGKFLWMPLCPKADGRENFICRRRTSLFTLNTPLLDVHSYPLLSVPGLGWDSPSFVTGSLAAQSKGQFYWTVCHHTACPNTLPIKLCLPFFPFPAVCLCKSNIIPVPTYCPRAWYKTALVEYPFRSHFLPVLFLFLFLVHIKPIGWTELHQVFLRYFLLSASSVNI